MEKNLQTHLAYLVKSRKPVRVCRAKHHKLRLRFALDYTGSGTNFLCGIGQGSFLTNAHKSLRLKEKILSEAGLKGELMKRTDLLKKCVAGDSDYHSLMRSVVFNIVAQEPVVPQSEIDKFVEIRFFKRHHRAWNLPVHHYQKIEHLPNSVLQIVTAWIHCSVLTCNLKMCRYCESRLFDYLRNISPTLYFLAYVCEDEICELCGVFEPMEIYGE